MENEQSAQDFYPSALQSNSGILNMAAPIGNPEDELSEDEFPFIKRLIKGKLYSDRMDDGFDGYPTEKFERNKEPKKPRRERGKSPSMHIYSHSFSKTGDDNKTLLSSSHSVPDFRKVHRDSVDGSKDEKRRRRRKVKRPRDNNGDDCDELDDNASVISSSSEHSVKLRKKKKSRRSSCEVHSKLKRNSASLPNLDVSDLSMCGDKLADDSKIAPIAEVTGHGDTPDKGGGTVEPPLPVCTCRRERSKQRKPRPEPEGGYSTSKYMYLDEYDRVINSTDPLFSDMEDDPVIDNQIRQESERHHKRAAVLHPGNIFSAAQLLNTNTMMKFAIIQTELRNIIDVSLRRVGISPLVL